MKAIWVFMLILAVMVSVPSASISNDGKYINDTALIGKYGEYAFQTLQKFPALVMMIKNVKPDFAIKDVGTSFPTEIFQTNDGRRLLIFSGCTPHNCGGTANVILFDPKANLVYVLRENSDQTSYRIFGSPPESIQRILIDHWKNR